MESKAKNFKSKQGIDWGLAEQLAFGSLMLEGTPVRLSGQDSERGTFGHRHAVWYDSEDRTRYVPLLNMEDRNGKFCVYNSLLSEAAVLAFDYGYSLDYPSMLAIWEAQFGDFANGAQVIIDQFIMSAEDKWGAKSLIWCFYFHMDLRDRGPSTALLVLKGSSKVVRKIMSLVANEHTWAPVLSCTSSPEEKEFAKPLIIMSPKSLLRHKLCVSSVSDLTNGEFQEFIDDPTPPAKTENLILCSGKVCYDLVEARESMRASKSSIVRIEQFYPFNEKLLKILQPYLEAKRMVWCQEEPENMGAWSFLAPILENALGKKVEYIGRS